MRKSLICLSLLLFAAGAFAGTFKVGYGERDITPTKPMPMWGYGARHALLSKGVLDPLFAKAVVIDVGTDKLALVGLDLGRGPTEEMMKQIRESVKTQSGVNWVMISGSHTHHGPVIELKDEPGKGQGKYDDCVAYAKELPGKISDAINEAASRAVDARIGWGSRETDLNRNRHTKKQPKPRDPELAVIRFDDMNGGIIAIMANLAAHATIHDEMDLRFTSEWPGRMQNAVAEAMQTKCFYMQGAAGDMSPNTNETRSGIGGFGKAVAEVVVDIAKGIETRVPALPSIRAMDEEFSFDMRIDIENPAIRGAFKLSFFPEIMAMADEFTGNIIRPVMTTLLLNGELALVSGSGEFFCEHANRLKRDSKAPETFWIGYCNGHHMYFPTREAIEEGGYGADPAVSWVPPGAGEQMIDKALANIDALLAQQ